MEIHALTYVCTLFFAVVSCASVGGKNCRCVPDQWEGILASTDREFDLNGGNSGAMENNLFVSYDFLHKQFAMTDLKTGNKAMADYNKGYKYVIREDGCRGLKTEEHMMQMCLPDHAEYLGEFMLGTDIPVDMWQFSGPFNVSMKTTVIQKNCMPITEEVYMLKQGLASLTSSLYLDVTTGIKDMSVFTPPVNCMLDAHRRLRPNPKHKRNENAWSLLGMLKQGMYQQGDSAQAHP